MINLCLVVIATQFSETKQRENQLMQEQRARYLSNDSTLASYSEPGSCYEEMLRYISHLYRKVKRRASRIYSSWQSKRRKKVNPNSGGGGGGGGANGHSRHRAGGHWVRSIHNLIQQHQRKHCHLSNGSPSPVTATGPGEALEMRSITTRPQLTVSSQPSAMHNLSSRTQSVHSIYKGDFQEAPQGQTSTVTGCAGVGVPALGRLNGGMNYPTILPSLICSYTGSSSAGKERRESDGNTGCDAIDPFEKLHQLMGEHSEFFTAIVSTLYQVRL